MHMTISKANEWARKQGKTIAAVAVGVIIGSAGPAIVHAAIPDSGGVVHGCYTTGSSVFTPKGSVRVIDSASTASCPSGTTALNWDQHASSTSSSVGSYISDLTNRHWNSPELAYRNFAGVDMHGGVFAGATMSYSDFHGANLSGSTFDIGSYDHVNMQSVNSSNTDIHSDTFVGTDLSTANLTGVTWDGVQCPDGTYSSDHADTCLGHLVP
jgi:hypothetical protein